MNLKKVFFASFVFVAIQPCICLCSEEEEEGDAYRFAKSTQNSDLTYRLKDPKKIAQQKKARILAGTFKTCSKNTGKFYRR